jgi:hypothetical protein
MQRAFATDVVVGEALPPIEHGFTHFRLTLHPQRIGVRTWPPRAEAPGLVWLTRDDALSAALPAPIKALIRRFDLGGAICRSDANPADRRQQLFVIGVCRAKRGEFTRSLVTVAFARGAGSTQSNR